MKRNRNYSHKTKGSTLKLNGPNLIQYPILTILRTEGQKKKRELRKLRGTETDEEVHSSSWAESKWSGSLKRDGRVLAYDLFNDISHYVACFALENEKDTLLLSGRSVYGGKKDSNYADFVLLNFYHDAKKFKIKSTETMSGIKTKRKEKKRSIFTSRTPSKVLRWSTHTSIHTVPPWHRTMET